MTANGLPVPDEVWNNILDAGVALGLARADLDA